MDLTEHFTLEEFTTSQTAARRGIDNTPPDEMIPRLKLVAEAMEHVRYFLKAPIKISSGFRCLELNRAIGSSDHSAHVAGWAVDFTSPKFGTPYEICERLIDLRIPFDQLIYEGSWVHISFDPRNRMEVLTAKFVNGKAQYLKGLVNV